MLRYKSKYKKVGVLPIWIVKSKLSSVGLSSERNTMFLSDEGPTLETLDFTIPVLYIKEIGNTETLCGKFLFKNKSISLRLLPPFTRQ